MITKIPPFMGRGIVPLPVIPTVYTDALSYGEQVGKMVKKLDETVEKTNEVVEDNNTFKSEVEQEITEFENTVTDDVNEFEGNMNTWKGEVEEGLDHWKSETEGAFQAQIDTMDGEWEQFLRDYQREYGVTQVTGDSTTDVMSQKAVSDIIANELIKGSGGIVDSSGLSDVNAAPVNQVFYINDTTILHLPEPTKGTLFTYGFRSTANFFGRVQIYITESNVFWVRKGNNVTSWDTWFKTTTDANNGILVGGILTGSDLTNFNNADVNKIFYINATGITNQPSSSKGTLMTYWFRMTGANIGKVQIYVDNSNHLFYRTSDTNNNWTNWDSKKDYLDSTQSVCGFRRIGVIGDSISVGYIHNFVTDTDSPRNLPYSWVQQFKRFYGVEMTNFGASGVTTKTWQTNEYCYPLFNADGAKCQAYIIGLGINDAHGSMTIGSTSDFAPDYMDNADTFYGNYEKIIRQCVARNPSCKIFCLTMPRANDSAGTYTTYNEAIRNICSSTSVASHVSCIDLASNYYTTLVNLINTDYYSGHYSAVGYAKMAKYICRAISEYIDAHTENFKNIAFIDYDS